MLNFGGSRLWETPISEPPIFVKFSLFLISTHPENLRHPALMVLKFKILAASLEGLPILIPPNFVKFDLFFIFTYLKNFMHLA